MNQPPVSKSSNKKKYNKNYFKKVLHICGIPQWRFLVCPDKKIYYVTCFRVMVFCNKCPLSILTQVFVSYFCFLTSESCTISC